MALQLALVYGKGIDDDGFIDRAYRCHPSAACWILRAASSLLDADTGALLCRLHYHETQNRTDQFSGCAPTIAL